MCLLFSLQNFSQQNEIKKDSIITIPEGTVIETELIKNINGRDLKIGDVIEFMLSKPIIMNNIELVPYGQKILGTVTDAKGSRMLGKKGKLEFTIDYLYLNDGNVIKLSSTQKKNLEGSGIAVAATSVILTPFALLIHGKNAKFKKGDKFNCFIKEDYKIKVSI